MSGPWLYDRVKDTSTTTGTGTLTLANSAPTGYQTFGSVLSNSDTCYYVIQHQTLAEWECGLGTYTSSGTTLARTTVVSSSNSGSAVNFSSGTKDVFIAPPSTCFGDLRPEIAVTGATTATIDRMHYCTGTSADYTVTLPAASGNAGRRLWFRMAPLASLSKLVTLDGNASETIDGATTRVMWAGETAELWCDGSNWFKRAGRSIPMIAAAGKNSNTTVSTATATKIGVNTSLTDNTGSVVNTGSTRLDVKRAGIYEIVAQLTADTSAITASQVRVHKNGSFLFNNATDLPAASGEQAIGYYTLAAGDYLELYAHHSTGSNRTYYGAVGGENSCSIAVAEQPQW